MYSDGMDEKEDPKKPQPPRTIVDEGTTLKGTLNSSCPVLVQGAVDGMLEAPAVTVSATGSITGKVTTEKLRSIGKIAGDYNVKDAQLAGTVESKTQVSAESLHLKLTATEGRIELKFGPTRNN
jgi:cytoskeletal protein CcmA (bactofilin family)